MLIFLTRSNTISSSVKSALEVCAKTVIPSLFPFMILSNLTVKLGVADSIGTIFAPPFRMLFGLEGTCATAVLLGAVSGFPIGAKSILSIYLAGCCSKEDAERTLAFCNNTGPAFVIAGIGDCFFGSMKIGIILYIIQIIAALIVGLLMRKKTSQKNELTYFPHTEFSLSITRVTSSITDATTALLHVCSFVVFFAVIADIIGELTAFMNVSPLLRAGIAGLLEITGGERLTAETGSGIASYILGAGILGWSGMSVHMQTMALASGSGLSLKRYFVGKLLQGLLSAGLAWCYFHIAFLQIGTFR